MEARLSRAMAWDPEVRIFEMDVVEGIRECSPIFPAAFGLGLLSDCSIPVALSLLLSFHTFTFSPGLKSLEVSHGACYTPHCFSLIPLLSHFRRD